MLGIFPFLHASKEGCRQLVIPEIFAIDCNESCRKKRLFPFKDMGKAKELNATTTHELYEKAPSLELGKPFRVEDGSIRVHRQRKERGRKVVHSQIVCDALGDAKSRTGKLVTLSSGRTCAAGR